jgi:trehalose-6-phosphate synthase
MLPLYKIAMSKKIDFIWIGWPWIHLDTEAEEEELARILGERYKCFPIYIPRPVLNKHLTFCHDILFPLLHNMVGSNMLHCQKLLDKYRDVNSRFSDEILRNYTGNELIWI